jgi:hypothetical protein
MAAKKGDRPNADDPAQYKRFLEAAREAQADETEKGADCAFNKVTSKLSVRRSRPSGRPASS